MISLARIFGGARKVDVAGTTVDVHLGVAKVWSVNSTASNSKVRLPNWSTKMSIRLDGFDSFWLFGVGSNSFDIVDASGGTVASGVSATGKVMLFPTSRSGIGTWKAHVI